MDVWSAKQRQRRRSRAEETAKERAFTVLLGRFGDTGSSCRSGCHGKSMSINGSTSSSGNRKTIVLARPLASCMYYLKSPFPRVLHDGCQRVCLARHWWIPPNPPLPTSSRPFHEDEARVRPTVVFVGRPHEPPCVQTWTDRAWCPGHALAHS